MKLITFIFRIMGTDMDSDDLQVVLRVQKGDIDAFAVLVRKYTSEVSHFISGKTKDEALIDDVVQTAFIKLYTSINSLDTNRPVKPYLFQIAKNELYEQWRKYNKRYVSLRESAHSSSVQTDTEDVLHIDEAKQALNTLNPDQKNALLWFTEGYSYKDISRKMGKPINSVRTLIRRSRLYIKNKLNL